MISQTTLSRVREFCAPALTTGLIDENELNELLQSPSIIQAPKESKLFTKKEVTEKLQISIRQLDRLHEKGLITYIKAGLRSVRIPSESLEDFTKKRVF